MSKIKQINQAGITLIALVVTIIVLLILAGVTINLVLGENGLMGRAQLVYDTQTRAVIEQEIEQAKGYAQTYKQTWTGSYLEKVQEFLSNDEVLKAIGETTVTLGSKNGENFVILSVGGTYNYKITEDGIEWLENAEAAADLLRPEIVDLQAGDVSFLFSPSTPTQGSVTVTITERANLDKKGNTLRYKIGSSGTWTDYTVPFDVSDNCIIYVGLYNGKDYGATATGEVSNIDTTAPTSCTFTIGEVTTDSITITATASDAVGIKYFDFSTDGGSTYPAGNRYTIANPTSGSANKEFTFTGLSDNTSYTIRVKATDEAGNSLQSSTQAQETDSGNNGIATAMKNATNNEVIYKTGSEDGIVIPLSTDGTTTVKDNKNNEFKVPKNFGIAYDSGDNVAEGIVIEDTDHNQYVWIPVGSFINSSGEQKQVEMVRLMSYDAYLSRTTSNEEGCGGYGAFKEYGSSNGSYNNAKSKLSVDWFKNGATNNMGYYIARYEAGIPGTTHNYDNPTKADWNTQKPLSKKGVGVWNGISQTNASVACQDMYEGVKSDLMNSFAWDTFLIFSNTCGNDVRYNWGKVCTNVQLTGEGDKELNICDMVGNCREWTTETCTSTQFGNSGPATLRGGCYFKVNDSYVACGDRRGVLTSSEAKAFGFRPILFFT